MVIFNNKNEKYRENNVKFVFKILKTWKFVKFHQNEEVIT